jgi:Cytochrome P460
MKKKVLVASVSLFALVLGTAIFAHQERALRVPNGLAFSEFRGFETWPVIAVSQNHGKFAAILGNPVTIAAYRRGVPANGEFFPNGAKIAKIHWIPKTQRAQPGEPVVPGTLHDVDFMVKDDKRFTANGGWGWAAFEYQATSGTFRPANSSDSPPQGNDARCGYACHTIVRGHDFVFTEYAPR